MSEALRPVDTDSFVGPPIAVSETHGTTRGPDGRPIPVVVRDLTQTPLNVRNPRDVSSTPDNGVPGASFPTHTPPELLNSKT